MLVQTGSGGVLLSPGAIRSLQQLPPEDVLHDAWQVLTGDGLSVEASRQYEQLIDAVRKGQGVLNVLPMASVKQEIDERIVELHPPRSAAPADEVRHAGRRLARA